MMFFILFRSNGKLGELGMDGYKDLVLPSLIAITDILKQGILLPTTQVEIGFIGVVIGLLRATGNQQ